MSCVVSENERRFFDSPRSLFDILRAQKQPKDPYLHLFTLILNEQDLSTLFQPRRLNLETRLFSQFAHRGKSHIALIARFHFPAEPVVASLTESAFFAA